MMENVISPATERCIGLRFYYKNNTVVDVYIYIDILVIVESLPLRHQSSTWWIRSFWREEA
jgi:hypothetical protein